MVALACLAPAAVADEPSARDVYFRRKLDVPQTIRWLADEAKRIRATQILFVLDAATFAPPAGLTEYSSAYAYFEDMDDWISALGGWASGAGVSFRASSSLAPRTVCVGTPGWDKDLAALVGHTWWRKGTRSPASSPRRGGSGASWCGRKTRPGSTPRGAPGWSSW
jgi:hypothetical protein